MHPNLTATMERQGGLITRRQALDLGATPDQLRRLTRRGDWVAVRRGVYADHAHWVALARRQQEELRARAAHLTMVTGHVMSHQSAALLLGLPVLLPPPSEGGTVHVTRPGVTGSRTEHGVKHHLAPYAEEQVITVDDIRCLDHARTAVDVARESGLAAGLVTCDGALRAGVPRHELERAVAPMRSWPGVTQARDAVDLADPGAENLGESLARHLVLELGIGRPQTQFGLDDGVRRAWCDLRVGRHVFEFDGRVKYRRRELGGVATQPPEEVVWDEKVRQDWVCAFGLGMSRIIWDDLFGRCRREARRRLAREYAATEARYGTSIDDLRGVVVPPRAV